MEKIQNNKGVNISLTAQKFGISRNTVKRHLKIIKGSKIKRKRRECILYKYDELIKDKLSDPNNSLKAIYMYLFNICKFNELKSYSNFVQYVRLHYSDIRKEAKIKNRMYRYETPIGKQLQFDRIEDLQIKLKNGTIIKFNIWSATLGYSRFHVFIVTKQIREVDFRRCFIETIVTLGGVPEVALTDNMSAIVNINGNKKNIHPTVIQFMKDINVQLKLCKIRTPRTKGKVEVSNKYAEWLKPYEGMFETENDLYIAIPAILNQCNNQINSETKIPPYILFNKKEKNALRPLPSIDLMKKYHSDLQSKKVNSCALVELNGAKYGVPFKYVGKEVQFSIIGEKVQFYNNKMESIGIYNFTNRGIHYNKGMFSVFKELLPKNMSQQEYEKNLEDNLANLAKVGSYELGE